MGLFTNILNEELEKEDEKKDEVEDTEKKDKVEGEEEEPKEEEPEEEPEPKDEEPKETESECKEDLKDLIMTILDSLETEMLAQGEELEEDESPDVSLEIIYRLIPDLSDEQCKMITDTLSSYYEIELGEGEDEEEFYEEPKDEDKQENDYLEDTQIKKEPDVTEVPIQGPAQ
jgi:hypothetical protein